MSDEKKTGHRGPAFIMMVPRLQEIARLHAYALAVHGSLARDLDLLAAPWVDWALPAHELAEAIRAEVGGRYDSPLGPERDPNPAYRAHGRLAWSIYLNHGCGGPYIDLSIMPVVSATSGGSDEVGL